MQNDETSTSDSHKQIFKKLKQANKKIRHAEELLRSVFDTSLISISVLEAVRNEAGHVEDFTIKLVNNELERETGRNDLLGKLYTREYPGVIKAGIFDMMLNVMQTGVSEQAEYFYSYEGFNKWFVSMFVKMGDGLVATNLDISKTKQADEDKLTMVREQNQKIFWATLNIQEIERRRIAESLHNGLGQLLFGIKMTLEQQDFSSETNTVEENDEIKQSAVKLIEDAITETRGISHELIPAILETFGLKEAITEICFQFRHNVQFTCNVTGLVERLTKPLELAIYRIAQELITNIIKHANATMAVVSINVNKNTFSIVIQDNGVGFQNSGKSDGIGLKTIRNKVELLNGYFNIDSNPGINNMVTIYIPYSKII